MKNFDVKTKIYFGENALARLSDIGGSVSVVADPFTVKSNLIDFVLTPLKNGGADYSLFCDVVPDPPIEKIIEGVAFALKRKSPVIIAVGGGSAMDTAKAIRKFAGQIDTGYRPRLICIPTTSGTGSEVTSFAVITDNVNNTKIPLASDDMLPDEAILDEVLVKSVPANITADTGMDVLTHAMEAYVSINNNEFSGALAEKAVEICSQFQIDKVDILAFAHSHCLVIVGGIGICRLDGENVRPGFFGNPFGNHLCVSQKFSAAVILQCGRGDSVHIRLKDGVSHT